MTHRDQDHQRQGLKSYGLLFLIATATSVLAQPPGNAGGPPPEGMQPPGMQQASEVDRSKDCDRSCLRKHADQYLTALAANDPSGLEVTQNFQHAENSHPVALGANSWKTVQAVLPERIYFTDPFAGQVLVLGTLEMNANQPFIYAVRLKVEEGKLAESEMMVTSDRIAGQHFRPDLFDESAPILDSVLPLDQRRTREQLLTMANVQWNRQPGTPPKIAKGCSHYENWESPNFPCQAVNGSSVTGPSFLESRHQRAPLIDTEKGVVVGYELQDVVNPQPRTPPEGERTPVFYYTPLTFYLLQVAKFTGDEFRMDSMFMNLQELGVPALFAK